MAFHLRGMALHAVADIGEVVPIGEMVLPGRVRHMRDRWAIGGGQGNLIGGLVHRVLDRLHRTQIGDDRLRVGIR